MSGILAAKSGVYTKTAGKMRCSRVALRLLTVLSAALCTTTLTSNLWAQSVVASVPNTDVTTTGIAMIAHESQGSVKAGKPYWNSFTFGTVGVARNIELAATLYGVGSPFGKIAVAAGYKQRVEFAPHSRWEPTLAFGPMFPVSLSGEGLGIWTYGAFSVRLPKLRTRFTIGPSYGTRQIFGYTSLHMFAAIEQPVSKQVSLIADWFSGVHDLGAAVTAVQWNISHSFILIAGVKIPNSERAGPVAGLVELTYEFKI
jgi:hypothetical protein